MHKVFFALLCLARAAYGRQVQGSTLTPVQALRAFLLTCNSELAFNPQRLGLRSSTSSPTLAGPIPAISDRFAKHVVRERSQPVMLAGSDILLQLVGVGMMAGSAAKGMPQILRIVNSKSVKGLSPIAFYGDGMVYLSKVAYHVRMRYPVEAWGELLFLLGQNAVCINLLHRYSKDDSEVGMIRPLAKGPKFRWVRAIADALILASAGLMFANLPDRWLPFLSLATAPMLLTSYSAQAWTNFARRSTGQLSVGTVFLRWAGSLVRVVTTIAQLNGDIVVLANHLLGVLGCSVLLLQLWLYRDGKQAKAGPSPASPGFGLTEVLAWRSLGGFSNEVSTMSDAALREAFDKIDTDGGGTISKEELLAAIARDFGSGTHAEEAAKRMMAAADADGNDEIDFDEYKKIVQGL